MELVSHVLLRANQRKIIAHAKLAVELKKLYPWKQLMEFVRSVVISLILITIVKHV
jgi:hypothetical protein